MLAVCMLACAVCTMLGSVLSLICTAVILDTETPVKVIQVRSYH